MKIYEIPKGSKLRVETDKGMKIATFHHLDGAYSYCTLDEAEEKEAGSGLFHISASTPLIYNDGAYEIEQKP